VAAIPDTPLESEPFGQRITHLPLIHGSGVALERTALFVRILAHAKAAAEGLGRSLVVARTNAKPLLGGVDWNRYGQGPVLASVGLALGGLLHTAIIPSGRAILDSFKPTASHPGVDPLWSTEGVEFVHDGADTTRTDKLGLIATSDLALRHLRVCWENRDGAYNCGRWEKCLRTMIPLKLAGALRRDEQFPDRITPVDLDRMAVGQPDRWEGPLGRIRSSGLDPLEWAGIPEAIERALARWRWSHSRIGRLDAAPWKGLAPVGLTPQRLNAVDARLLGRAGVRAFHWPSTRRGRWRP